MPPDSHSPPGDLDPRTPRKPPSSYRPDVRPMLILAGLLVAVIGGWILLSPLILPPPVR
jgi:hypothetical protein